MKTLIMQNEHQHGNLLGRQAFMMYFSQPFAFIVDLPVFFSLIINFCMTLDLARCGTLNIINASLSKGLFFTYSIFFLFYLPHKIAELQ